MIRTFRSFVLTALLLASPVLAAAQRAEETTPPRVVITPGMVITHSVRIVARAYPLRASESLDSPLITIRGSNITVDFSGATLDGVPAGANPDEARGLAIRVDGGTNIRIRNARVHGYKIALLARNTRDLSLLDNDFSRNWKPRLFSVIEHESLVDWLSHHHNDKDEWLRFGAGAYLADVHGGEIRNNRIEHGMEGLMLVRCDSLRIWNNTIQFNSGVGIGLYRSSDNVIMHNYASFNVRGYSHGFFRRGQDSADLLMYEQSSRNIVAYNSMTHGGDGLFLWAGQTTMDTGASGANDNVFYRNDFSYAPTNAMEATFSRNAFIENRAFGSEYGLWGGYSFDSQIVGNSFGNNRTGIAIEHGQNNKIFDNRFVADSTAINLWAVPEQPSDWGYPKHRDTRSVGYEIARNSFTRNRVALRVANTTDSKFADNEAVEVDSLLVVRDTMTRLDRTAATAPKAKPVHIAPLSGGFKTEGDPLAQMPRSAIIVDEWGPYDWREPKLWPADSANRTPMPLRVLGPTGSWRVVARTGVAALSHERGRMNDTLVVTPVAGRERDWSITLADNHGKTFSFERFEPIARWSVDFYTQRDSVRGPLLLHRDMDRLDFMWYRPSISGLPQENFATVASSTVTLAPGEYTLRTISDDAIRVWVDEKLVIDDWTPHESAVDTAPMPAGTHAMRVEHRQRDGWTELRVEIVRGAQRSTGSPGPH